MNQTRPIYRAFVEIDTERTYERSAWVFRSSRTVEHFSHCPIRAIRFALREARRIRGIAKGMESVVRNGKRVAKTGAEA